MSIHRRINKLEEKIYPPKKIKPPRIIMIGIDETQEQAYKRQVTDKNIDRSDFGQLICIRFTNSKNPFLGDDVKPKELGSNLTHPTWKY
ncbi:MAG: hypothetical protein AB8B89_04620 [Gammaproteobacteria bacterium]